MKKKVTHLKIATPENENISERNSAIKSPSMMPDINLNIKGGSPKIGMGMNKGVGTQRSVKANDNRPVSKLKSGSRSVSRNRKIENMSVGKAMGIGIGMHQEVDVKEDGFTNVNINNSNNVSNINNFLRSSGKRKTDPIHYPKREGLKDIENNNNNNNLISSAANIANVSNINNLPGFNANMNNNLKISATTPKYSMNKPNILSPIHSSTNSGTNFAEPISARNSSQYTCFNKANYNSTKQESNTINVMSLLSSQHIPLTLNTLKQSFAGYETSKFSSKSIGNIKAYAANTHQGTVRNYNEDRVSIILNIVKPQSYTGEYWPKCSIFGVYDGHGGNACADYLRDNLHQFVIKDPNFPSNPHEAILKGFENAEKDYLTNYAVGRGGEVLDRSGSCAIVVFIIDEMCYVANVGDSRAIMSKSHGKVLQVLTNDHKPNDESEEKRIVEAGGRVYQTQTPTKNFNLAAFNGNYNLNLSPNQILVGPYRVFPGRLSVSRTFGDVEAKLSRLGGMQNVVIATPEITSFKMSDDMDFIFIGCDGIYDQLSNKDILDSIWMTTKEGHKAKNVHSQCSLAIDMVIKSSLVRKSLDNVTCVLISFEGFEKFLSGNNSSYLVSPPNNASNILSVSNNVSPHINYKDSPTRLFKSSDNSEAFDKNSNDSLNLKQCQPLSTKNNRAKNSFVLDSNAKEYFLKMDSSNSPRENAIKKSPPTNFRMNNRKSFNSHIERNALNSQLFTNSNGFLNSPVNSKLGSSLNNINNVNYKHQNKNSYSNNNLSYKEQLDIFNKNKDEKNNNEFLPLVKTESSSYHTGNSGIKSKLIK